jgi:protocatechuate 3,4-dioxygenase beta subunit
VVTTEERDVTLTVTGSAAGGGLVNIVAGVGTRAVTNTVPETVTLGLSDTEGTTLDVSSTQSVVFGAGTATQYLVTVDNAAPAAGTDVTVTAQLADQFGNPVALSGQVVTWSGTNGGTFSAPTSTTSPAGSATVTFTTSVTAGTEHVVTATDGSSRTGNSPTITTQ